MPHRFAAVSSVLVFIVCLVAGGIGADNTFSVSVGRALLAMIVTLVVGLIVGAMAQKMVEENVKSGLGVSPVNEADAPATVGHASKAGPKDQKSSGKDSRK